MNRHAAFDLMRDLLDHELLDSEGISCGMVDDIELEGGPGTLEPVALLVGPGAWQTRLPALVRLLIRAVAQRERVRVPFAEVASISEVIRLRSPATQLGLGVLDRRVGRWLRKAHH
jgi:sporulation protein YlmC with PRC-barrel domain